MQFEIGQKFFFDAAHTLDRDIETLGSRRIHGHTYWCEVALKGKPDAQTGMVLDLGQVRLEIESIKNQLDHHFLDEVAGLGAPTLENLCAFIWRDLLPKLPQLSKVRVWRDSIADSCTLTRDGA
ncbi:6-carboxy-5,6,7,8-tetrahydropterin synthase [Polaromonas vacuolata]|uniref:6-carboxy-5,6,7,8-tetrahydropterin synthase n=1 Tax=Polaromonas vacuolata TaxID=37448 RepID=A0A6H2HC91_9BURK|nr:6-carboxytetrahydropterin synthase [Polaromonas vacuolata]QJC57377.1 6-carboxy-5,6,7,8-tetrahydropterin synthase [Polaromonas vacuolata]